MKHRKHKAKIEKEDAEFDHKLLSLLRVVPAHSWYEQDGDYHIATKGHGVILSSYKLTAVLWGEPAYTLQGDAVADLYRDITTRKNSWLARVRRQIEKYFSKWIA